MKITFLDKSHLQRPEERFDYSQLKHLGDFEILDIDSSEEIVSAAKDADVIVTGKLPLTERTFSQLPQLKLVVKAGTGVDKFDLEAARERNIAIANLPGYGSSSVAQFSVGLLLSLAGSISPYHDAVRRGSWNDSQFRFPVVELRNKTIGILGLGSIARQVIHLLSPFEMKILVATNYPDTSLDVEFVEREELYQRADMISVHSLLTKETRALLDAKAFAAMKDSCLIVNTARPGIFDEQDLVDAIAEKKISGVAMDGFWREPAEASHPLYQYPNVLITPHIAWAPQQTRQEMIHGIASVIDDCFSGNSENLLVP